MEWYGLSDHDSPPFTVGNPGWYNLYLFNKDSIMDVNTDYPDWRVDKIWLTSTGETLEGEGRSQDIVYDVEIPQRFCEVPGFLPEQIFREIDGILICEGEDIDHHSYWKMTNEPEGFSGSGFLVWQGPDRTKSIEGVAERYDSLGVRTGPREEWLIIRAYITNPGKYKLNVRNYLLNENSGNDVWVSMLGYRPDPIKKEVIKSIGDKQQGWAGFTWLGRGEVVELELQAGLNDIVIAGKSVGFGVDRIAIYKANDPAIEKKALSLDTEISKLYTN